MENIGREPSTNHGSVHGPGYSGSNALSAAYSLPGGRNLYEDFHVFSVQWSKGLITFYVDGVSYETVTRAFLPSSGQWVFDNAFFLLLNVAVGGSFPGAPDTTTQFPRDMLVDYVRVYQQQTNVVAPIISSGGVADAAAFGPTVAPGGLASVFGSSLAPTAAQDLFDPSTGAFVQSYSGIQILVNGAAAPLIYVSPAQINFQVPWETLRDYL